MTYKGYVGTVEYSQKDGCLFGRIVGIQDIVSYEGESVTAIQQAFEDAVDDYLEHCAIRKRTNTIDIVPIANKTMSNCVKEDACLFFIKGISSK